MSKSVTLMCDCGCGKSISDPEGCGWFKLSQIDTPRISNDPKLRGDLLFSSLACLLEWAKKANEALPGLQESACTLSPSGMIVDDGVSGLFV